MRGSRSSTLRPVAICLALLAGAALPPPSPAVQESSEGPNLELAPDLVPIFLDGFESQGCSLWSASSNPLGAPDQDSDTYGDAGQPTVYCQLPANLVPDASDCNDNDPLVHPGAAELCNGIDDDCSVNTPDGLGDPQNGLDCDGSDSDLCLEGTNSCTNGSIQCSDASGSTIDLCNGADDDCDPASADGSEDPQNGVACDGDDGDLCVEGNLFCSSASLLCSDFTGTTSEICNGLDDDCDGVTDEDFVLDSNPVCPAATVLGSIAGDTGSASLSRVAYDEAWFRFTLTEANNGSVPLLAQLNLYSGVGSDFDLYVYCLSCGGTLAGSSAVHGLVGHTDTVLVRANDEFAVDDTIDLLVEVRYFASSRCGNWTLDIFGNMGAAAAATCP